MAAESGESGGTDDFEALLEFLRDDRGFDFTGYKRPSLMRRVARRMADVGCATHAEYLDHLQVHPEEFAALFDTILINVTRFFRDLPTWNLLTAEILPALVAARPPDEAIRVWVAGCASGEEAYSLAIALAEVVGPGWQQRVKVYGTDVDEEALAAARRALYRRSELSGTDDALLERYFEPVGGSYRVRKDVRRLVIFGRHDLVRDAPISRVDVLSCRNTLMYFNAETQAQIVRRFRFALNDAGILMLGRAEMLLGHVDVFTPVDLRHRIFVKAAAPSAKAAPAADDGIDAGPAPIESHWAVRAALDASPVAQVVLGAGGHVAMVNERARAVFGIGREAIGAPFSDLDVSYRPIELRSIIDRVAATRAAAVVEDVPWSPPSGEAASFEVQVQPLVVGGDTLVGTSITFVDVSRYRSLREELEQANRDLETAYEELQSTNEELETTNEELQSTVEELETTNDELQSTNAELETMNDELQSTNQELQGMNDELRVRTLELARANVYLESILAGVRGALVVLDQELTIAAWNRGAEDLWGLGFDEVRGRGLLDLDSALPVEELAGGLRRCIEGGRAVEHTVDARTADGRPIRCRISWLPVRPAGDGPAGAVVLMEEVQAAGDG